MIDLKNEPVARTLDASPEDQAADDAIMRLDAAGLTEQANQARERLHRGKPGAAIRIATAALNQRGQE